MTASGGRCPVTCGNRKESKVTSSRPAACGRIPLGRCLVLAVVVLFLVSAGTANATTYIGTTTYTSNTTWTLANSPYVLNGDVTVAAGVTLTVEPGVIVKMNGLRTLRVNGTLAASGTSGSHITFTSLQDDAIGGDTGGDGPTSGAPGQWVSIKFATSTSSGTLNYVDVRYGGAGSSETGYGAVEVTNASASAAITNSSIKWSQASGLYVLLGSATVDATTISDGGNGISVNTGLIKVRHRTILTANSKDGIWFNLGSGTPAGSAITASDVTNNGRYGVYVGAGAQPLSLIPRGSFNNINGNTTKQLFASTSPSFKNADVKWRQNYWGQITYAPNNGECAGVSPNSHGSTGVMNGGSYLIVKTPPTPSITCNYDAFKLDPLEIAPSPLHGGSPAVVSAQTISGCGSGTVALAVNVASCGSDPVSLGNGSFANRKADLHLAGVGVPFSFSRTYNALDQYSGPLGPGWSHSLSAGLTIFSNGDVLARSDSGQRLYFTKQSDGSFVADPGGRSTLSTIAGGYELVDKSQTHLRFDTAGKLTSVRDRNDKGLTLSNTGSQLTSVTDSANRVINFTYNGSGLLTQVTLPDNRNVQFGYTNGLLTSATDARGKTTTYAYESHNWLLRETDPNGNRVFENTFGSDGRVTQQLDALNRQTTFAWNASTQTSTVTDARGKVWKDVYSNGVLVQQIDPFNNTTSYGYDLDLNLTTVTDPRSKTTTVTYDTKGNLLTRTAPAPLSYQEVFTYNSFNDVLTARDGRGNTTSLGYDAAGNLTSVTRPGNNVTQYGRDVSGNGLLRTVTDPRGKVTNFEYDTVGNLTEIRTPLGNKTTMTYDGSGRMTASVEPRGNVSGADPNDYKTTYTYNANDQPLTATNPLNHVTTYAYDNGGRVSSVTDPRSNATSYAYNAVDQLTTVTAQGGAATTYAYDATNNLTSRTDAKNHQTTYTYDDAGRLTATTNPLNKIWSATYDANGNATVITKPSGGTLTLTYDAINRLSAIDFSDTTPDVSYTYDGNSNRTQMTDGPGAQSYTYDALNRLTDVTRGSDGFTYDYDAAGSVTLWTYPGGATTSATYDDDNKLASATRTGNTANYSYNAAGSPTQVALPNGYIDSRTYDRAGRITQVKHSSGGNVLAQFDYAYDNAGNPTSVTTPTGTTTYGYDNRDRLTSVCFQTSCPGGADPFIRWTYDVVGNRLTEDRPTGTTTNTYNAGDQMTQSGSTTYTYDDNGNQTQAGSRTFTWNLAGQMTSTTADSSTTSYTYNGDGNRLQAAATSATTNYLWDSNAQLPRLAIERNGAGTALRTYAYGLELLSMLADGAQYYFHTDALSSVTNMTSSSGQAQWTYTYEPFGTTRTETKDDPSAPDNTIKFAGSLLDPGSPQYYLRARSYDATSGRFASLDPLAPDKAVPVTGSYVYAADSPVRYVDPSGLGPVRPDDASASPATPDPLAQNTAGNDCMPPAIYLEAVPPGLVTYFVLGYVTTCRALNLVEEHIRECVAGAVMGSPGGAGGALGGCAANVAIEMAIESDNSRLRTIGHIADVLTTIRSTIKLKHALQDFKKSLPELRAGVREIITQKPRCTVILITITWTDC